MDPLFTRFVRATLREPTLREPTWSPVTSGGQVDGRRVVSTTERQPGRQQSTARAQLTVRWVIPGSTGTLTRITSAC